MKDEAGLWARRESGRSRALIWSLAIFLVLAIAGVAFVLVGTRPNPAEGVRALLDATRESDEAGYARMSERYREANDMTLFRRALARVSEIRSATVVSRAPGLSLLDRPERVEFCTDFADVPGRVRAHVVWEDGEWFVDALAVEGAQVDPLVPAAVACGPNR